MAAHREESPGETGPPIPRDLPDQQTRPGEDPWDVTAPDLPDTELPDTDEAGTGRRGAPRPAGVRPGQPVPDEPSD
ncbi:hypothetical protein [Streptomyces griseoruber]|uniref:Uncharacterized protein n=1 Tax=Streptomyces griseoruber TaxID=1943 RepID=A0A124I4A2_9ACTN|nr:hypothetical protein [Streptomyces griseoruber]KUN86265.1 hypothetical protein AQJ64_09540 [Streptomyces griseoruber]